MEKKGSSLMREQGFADTKYAGLFEKTYRQRSIVESVFSSLKCRFTASCSRKETGNAKTAAAPQVHLLQLNEM